MASRLDIVDIGGTSIRESSAMSKTKSYAQPTQGLGETTEDDERNISLDADAPFVTPSTLETPSSDAGGGQEEVLHRNFNARRILFPGTQTDLCDESPKLVTPLRHKRHCPDSSNNTAIGPMEPAVKRRLVFGKYVDLIVCQPNVEQVYKTIRKLTGRIGGNASVGPIYGELTMGSMQKMVNLMMRYCRLDSNSRFIDVGSGIGKPNLHVAQFPGVSFSCGVEVEHSRWTLGMTCLKAVLDSAMKQRRELQEGIKRMDSSTQIHGNTIFLHTDITEAQTFDPFTHVYMFSIGFPPPLWLKLAKMWNHSLISEYLICYHSPKDVIASYEFDVEHVAQVSTSMHGSKEVHTGYIYKRKTWNSPEDPTACDKLFKKSWELVQNGLQDLHQEVTKQVHGTMLAGRRTRSTKAWGANTK